MSRRLQLVLYVILSLVDFTATVYLVSNGYADEANPLIRGFVAGFSSFPIGLAIYKSLLLAGTILMLRAVHRRDPGASLRLLLFANAVMLALGCWHIVCLRASLAG
jgi:hypothetical protein